jgi:hypothetical protein
MARADVLNRRLPALTWRGVGILAFLVVNLPLAIVGASIVLGGSWPSDLAIFVEASHRFGSPDLYAAAGNYAFRWHPLMALAFGPLSLIGVVGWRLLHVVAALAMPTWLLRLLVLVSWPFWWDVETGNIIVFILLAAVWALRGSRLATVVFLLLTVLVPRPLMLPVAAWLLWKRPEWRLPFAVMLVVAVTSAFATGYGPDWIGRLLSSSGEMIAPWNLGPSRLIGFWWLLIGLPLAAWLTWRGRLGLASLAASPYLLPFYLLMPLLELRSTPQLMSVIVVKPVIGDSL